MSNTDLSALRRERSDRPHRPRGPRVAVVALVLVLLGVVASFVVPLLRPARGVRTAPVLAATTRSATTRASTAEAAGWIEPDPFPVVVRPLVTGILETLPVLEGTPVQAGKSVVGVMRSAALEAARDRATARFALAEANLKHRTTELTVAESLLEQRADLRLAEATAKHDAVALAARLAMIAKEREAAEADLTARRADLGGQERLKQAGGTYPVALAKARAAVAAAQARVAAKANGVEAAAAELAKAEITLAIAQEVRNDPRALQGAVDNARANLGHLAAERDAAKVELEIARRELGWATIRSPIDGIVLRLLAAPGARVGPQGDGVVSLYDPKRLQARIDVPLAAVGGIRIDQDVEIRSEVLGRKSARGKVLRIQREADLLKNTLQVKVRLIDPDPILRPETLVRARFLAPPGEEGAARGPAVFRVPREAVRNGAVFVLDPAAGRARRVPVETVAEESGALLVRGELSPTQRVILDEVEDEERVEDASQ